MNYRIFISLTSLLITVASCAQSKYGIRRMDAFFVERMPGNIPVDDRGHSLVHGPDTINTVYIETTGGQIKWTSAWKNGRSFSPVTTPVNEETFEVGANKYSNEKVILRPAAGSKLWLVQLEKSEISSKPPIKANHGEIILKGKSGKKTVILRIRSQTELSSIPSV